MTIPQILYDYLEETEQNAEDMTNAKLLKEAEWVLWSVEAGEYYNDYTRAEIAKLKAYRTRLRNAIIKGAK